MSIILKILLSLCIVILSILGLYIIFAILYYLKWGIVKLINLFYTGRIAKNLLLKYKCLNCKHFRFGEGIGDSPYPECKFLIFRGRIYKPLCFRFKRK